MVQERNKIHVEVQGFDEKFKVKQANVMELRKRLKGYRKVEELDAKIRDLETSIETTTMSLTEEKKLMVDIKVCMWLLPTW